MAQQNVGSLIINLEARTVQIQQDMAQAKRIVGDAMGSIQRDSLRATQSLEGVEKGAESLAKVGVGAAIVAGLSVASSYAEQFTETIITAQREAARLERTLIIANGGNLAAVSRDMRFLDQTADSLGVRLKTLGREYGDFMAVASRTSLAGRGAQDVFEGFATAASAKELTMDDFKGTLKAISQMMGKGKVASEELYGQLAERLPEAAALAASAMGMTTMSFRKALEDGKILADDLLPRLAWTLKNEMGDAAKSAAAGLTGSINAFASETDRFHKAIAQGGAGEALSSSFKAATSVLTGITDHLDGIAAGLEVVGGVAVAAIAGRAAGALQQYAVTQSAVRAESIASARSEISAVAMIEQKAFSTDLAITASKGLAISEIERSQASLLAARQDTLAAAALRERAGLDAALAAGNVRQIEAYQQQAAAQGLVAETDAALVRSKQALTVAEAERSAQLIKQPATLQAVAVAQQAVLLAERDAVVAKGLLVEADARLAASRTVESALAGAATEAETRLTAARALETEASTTLATAEARLVALREAGVASAAAHQTASQRLAAAKLAEAEATSLTAMASRHASAAMAALGGPIGLAVVALTLLAMNWDKVADRSVNAADMAENSANRIKAALDKSNFAEADAALSQAQGRLQLAQENMSKALSLRDAKNNTPQLRAIYQQGYEDWARIANDTRDVVIKAENDIRKSRANQRSAAESLNKDVSTEDSKLYSLGGTSRKDGKPENLDVLNSENAQWLKSNQTKAQQRAKELKDQQQFLEKGIITQEEYQRRAKIIDDKYEEDKGNSSARALEKQRQKAVDAIAAIKAKIDAEQLGIDSLHKYGAAMGDVTEGEKEAIKHRRLAVGTKNDYVRSSHLAQAAEYDQLGVLQRLSKETAAYYALEKQITDAAAQGAFEHRQWLADAEQEIRLLGMAEPYRAAAQSQYTVEKQTKKELFDIQQKINQVTKEETAAINAETEAIAARTIALAAAASQAEKDRVSKQYAPVVAGKAALREQIGKEKDLLQSQYKTVETDGVKKSGQAGAQALTVQAKNAATEASKAARSMSAAWAASGDSVVKSIGQMMSAMGDYASQQADFAKEQAALDEQRGRTKGIADIEERGKAETALNALQIDLDKRRTDNNLAGTAQMMGLASQMFAEGSRGRKAAHAMEMTFLAIEISQKTASAVVDAVKAVANQGGGDPYTAIPRAIAMAAMMAGVLSQIGASFSAGGGVGSQALNTSGTVLGSTDPSQSVGNSLDWLQKLEADQYAELRGINSGMRDLNRNLSGVASAIYRNAGLTGKLPSPGVIGRQMGAAESFARDFAFTGIAALDNLLPGISGFFKNVIGGIAGKIFGGGSTTSIVGSGIMSGQTTLGNVMNGGILDVLAWQRTKTETDGGWFGSDETSYGQNISDIGGEVEQLMTQVFAGLGKTMLSVGEQLNIDASAAIKALSIQLPQIDLGGKSGADMQKAIEEAVSAVSDNAVSAVFGSVLRQYQHLNEGLLETATRTVGEMAVVNDALRMTGYGIKAAGLDASQSLVGLAGGATELHSAAESFFKSYYSEAEQSVFHAQRLKEQFVAMNVAAPQTKEAFRALVESQDITTESGRKTYASLLSVAGAFDDVVASADKLKNTLTSWLQSHQLGDQSVLSTEQKYGVARQQFDDMLQKAGSGNADAQGKLTSAADSLLALARDMFASGGQYVSLESYVTSQIQRLAGAIKLPGFATGGLAQGWAIVGEQGPELVNFTNPGRVYTADDTRNMLDWSRYGRQDNGALVAEVRALREEVSRMREENTELQQAQLAQRGQLGQMQMRQQDEQNRLAKRIAGNNALS